MRTRRLTIAGCALLLGAVLLCGTDLLLGALFFPIGPDGLSPRDAAVRALSPWLWGGAGFLGLAGVVLLLLVGVRALRRR
jgi:hypothetical protein